MDVSNEKLKPDKDLLEAQKSSNYDKLYLRNDGFDEERMEKKYPKEFEELLKEFGIQ